MSILNNYKLKSVNEGVLKSFDINTLGNVNNGIANLATMSNHSPVKEYEQLFILVSKTDIVKATSDDDGNIYIPLKNINIKVMVSKDIYYTNTKDDGDKQSLSIFDLKDLNKYQDLQDDEKTTSVPINDFHLKKLIINTVSREGAKQNNKLFIEPLLINKKTLILTEYEAYITDEELKGNKNINFKINSKNKNMIFSGMNIESYLTLNVDNEKSRNFTVGINYVDDATLKVINTSTL